MGDEVFCGTINRFGAIDITATKVGEDSSLQKLIRMVQEAEDKQAPMQRIADRVASWLVPVALLIAVLAYVVSGNIVTAVTILVVFCPCALRAGYAYRHYGGHRAGHETRRHHQIGGISGKDGKSRHHRL